MGGTRKNAMSSLESLIGLVGQQVTSAAVQSRVASDRLISSSDPDLEEGEAIRSYLSRRPGGYQLIHTDGRIRTLFVFLVPPDGYQQFCGSLVRGLSLLSTRSDVRKAFGKPDHHGKAQTIPVLGRRGAWDRFDQGPLCWHFQNTEPEERLRQITVMSADTAP
jgi:hypothetical protein